MSKKLLLSSLFIPFIIICCFCGCDGGGVGERAPMPSGNGPKQPGAPAFDSNIVVIVIDTLRADHLPFYGYPINTAPFLNELSKESAVFERAYSTSSWTAPATASIFTSLYPSRHGVVTGMMAYERLKEWDQTININKIPENLTTMGEALKAAGFRTYGVSDNLNISEKGGFHQGFDRFRTFEYISAEEVNEQLRKWEKEIKKSGKYFLYIQYMDPHAPYNYREPWFKEVGNARVDTSIRYDSEINYVDTKIREMFELFGWDEKTLVIVTSDHGEEIFDRGHLEHGHTLFDELVRVPFFIYFPDGEITADRINRNVSILDILPTLRELIGLAPDANAEGLSLVPLLRNHEIGERHLFAELERRKGDSISDIDLKAAIHGNWKYILSASGSEELYNLERDPKETVNKIDESPQIAESMRHELKGFQNSSKKFGGESVSISLDEKTLDHLKSLGYLQ